MVQINVVHIKKHKATPHDFYCGRPSPLGNRYTHKATKTIAEVVVGSREEAIERYRQDFPGKMDSSPAFKKAFEDIYNHLCSFKIVNLICWCAPLSCHCDVIKENLEKRLSVNLKTSHE